ncbi:unnamed protein product, partial [Closterium sp. NIES-54]
DITFDKPVPFFRLFPYRSAPPSPLPLFLAPGPPPVGPLPPQGPAPSIVSQVDPLPGTAPFEVAVGSGAAPGVASGGDASGGAEPGGAGSEDAGSGGAEPGGEEPGGAEPEGVEPEGAESEGAGSGGAEPRGGASSEGPAGASPRLSPQQLREWLVRRARLQSGAPGAGGAGDAGAGDTTQPGAAGAGGSCAGGAGAGGAGVGGTGARGAGAARAGAVHLGAGGARGSVLPRPYFFPLLHPVVSVPSSTRPSPPLLCPPPDQSQPPLQPASPLPAPSPYTEQSGGLTERLHVPLPAPPESSLPEVPDPESDRARAASPTISRLLAIVITDPSFYLFARPPSLGGECALGTDALEGRHEDFECLAAAVPRFASMLLAPEGDPDAPDIPTPRSYAEAITGPYSSQWQAAMDDEMASWKSTGTYVDEVPPHGANIVDSMCIFRVKRPPGSPPAFKARYVAQGFSQRQGVDYFQTFSPTPKMTTLWVMLHVTAQHDYELHSLDFSTAFLQGNLHEEIWLRRPPGFTESFPAGTQWSLRRPVYGLCQAPREWHDTLRTTLAAFVFALTTADTSLFLRTDASLPTFYVLVYVDNLVCATADTEALTLVKSELQKRHTCTDLGELRSYLGLQITRDRAQCTITLTQSQMVHQVLQRFSFQFSSPQPTPLSTSHSLSAPPSDESVEPSGPYPELVGCLMYLMTCTRPDLTYPLSLLAHYVAPGRHQKVHWDAVKRVLRYLCSMSGMGLVRGGRGPVVVTGHADAYWELHWLTYLLTDLGEQPRSPPVLYVDNKAMIALCQEHRLEHRTKHIALRYFLAQELQQRGQIRLAYVATRANTADIFTKALLPVKASKLEGEMPLTKTHIHVGVTGQNHHVLLDLPCKYEKKSNNDWRCEGVIEQEQKLSDSQVSDFVKIAHQPSGFYGNIHTKKCPDGAVRELKSGFIYRCSTPKHNRSPLQIHLLCPTCFPTCPHSCSPSSSLSPASSLTTSTSPSVPSSPLTLPPTRKLRPSLPPMPFSPPQCTCLADGPPPSSPAFSCPRIPSPFTPFPPLCSEPPPPPSSFTLTAPPSLPLPATPEASLLAAPPTPPPAEATGSRARFR